MHVQSTCGPFALHPPLVCAYAGRRLTCGLLVVSLRNCSVESPSSTEGTFSTLCAWCGQSSEEP